MIVIIGLDGVLASHAWREGFILDEGWDAYHAQAANDKPIEPMLRLLDQLGAATVVCVADRAEKYRMMTEQWFVKNNCLIDELRLRADDDWRPGLQVKIALAADLQPDLVIDADERVLEHYRARKVLTLQVA